MATEICLDYATPSNSHLLAGMYCGCNFPSGFQDVPLTAFTEKIELMKIQCPNCRKPYDVDNSLVGKSVKCKACNERFNVETTGDISSSRTSNLPPPIPTQTEWFYILDGQRVGPVSESELKTLIGQSKLNSKSIIWKKGFSDWLPISTALPELLFSDTPPAVPMEAVNNLYAWEFALVPIIGAIIGLIELNVVGNMDKYPFPFFAFLASFGMNAFLAYRDEKELKKAGHSFESGLKVAAVILVPVYLFFRASRLKHNFGYAFAWIAAFILSLLI
jgi:predicted Zn finger-like uncharacterized protein